MATATVGTSRARIASFVEHSPGAVPAGIAVATLLWFTGDEGGFRGTTWMPAELLLLAVLFVCLLALPRPTPSRAALIGLLLLTGYGLWTLLSVLWAGQEELAWDAGNRTVLYALIVALCTLWPVRGNAIVVLLGAFGLGVAGIALVEMIKASGSAQGVQYFNEARFSEPVGYSNANVAMWMLGFMPCAILGGRKGIPAPLRGLFLGSAVLLAGAALLGESRGWLIALPVAALVAVIAVPGRGRTIVSFGVVGIALAPAIPSLLDFYDAWHPFRPPGDAWDSAFRALLLCSIGLAMVGGVAAVLDNGIEVRGQLARRISAAVVIALAGLCVAGVVAYSAVEGSPSAAVKERWDNFRKGGSEPRGLKNRFGGTFGTYRYNYWQVAWREFKDKPILGAGGDNFGRNYQQRGTSSQTPRYPHSTGLVALSETGIVGGLLLFGAFVALVIAAIPSLRRADLAGAAAGAGVLMFAYWLAHSSLDWFWEFPGLAGAGLAGLGLATAVRRDSPVESRSAAPLLAGKAVLALGIAGTVLIAASVIPPWLSAREVRNGGQIASSDPIGAVERFDRAADWNPLSPTPQKAAAIVEIRAGRYAQAEQHLVDAFKRDDQDSGMYLMLAVLRSSDGRADDAKRLIDEAYRLAPHDLVIQRARPLLHRGHKLDPRDVDKWIQLDLKERTGGVGAN